MTELASAVHKAAREAYRAGLCVVPTAEDGSKEPIAHLARWKHFQTRRPTKDEMRQWYPGRQGIGTIVGRANNRVECWDFDDRATYEAFVDAAREGGLGLVIERIESGYVDDTPGDGVRWLVRYPEDIERTGQIILARRPKRPEEMKHDGDNTKALIELPLHAILAPSNGKVHPTGRPYVHRCGGFSTIAEYTDDERDALMALAGSFDQTNDAVVREPAVERGGHGTKPGEAWAARTSWSDILEPHGWKKVFTHGAVTFWRRPGKSQDWSATTNHGGNDTLKVFSTSTVFESVLATKASYTKLGAYALLEHGGDFSAAARALAAQGYGDPPRAAAAATNGRSNGHQREITLTDTGNATRFVRLHGEKLRYVPRWDKWLVWDGTVWQIDHGAVRARELAKDIGFELKREAAEVTDAEQAKRTFKFAFDSLSHSRIGNMVNLARGIDGVLLDYSLLDLDGYLFGVANGIIDLRTGELRPAHPDFLMTMQAPVQYDTQAEAPRFRLALEEWFPDPEVRSYVQRLVGAALVGEQRDHVFVIHYGGGSNGKGTFMRALRHALGRYSVVIHLSLIEQTRHKEHDTEKAHLFRARLAIASETERRVKLAEASVKNLTGGDPIHARRMREDPWEFDPTHSLWLQTNHLPEISGRDTGIWRRIRVVRWVSTFTGETQDHSLDETLSGESAGILRWCVEGCLAWQREGLHEPEAVVRETMAYRHAEDKLARFAADSGLGFGKQLRIQAGDVQRLLNDWAESEGIDPPRKEVGDWLRENSAVQKNERWVDPETGKRRRGRFWIGFGEVREQNAENVDNSESRCGTTDGQRSGTGGTASTTIGSPARAKEIYTGNPVPPVPPVVPGKTKNCNFSENEELPI